jgi:DNA polymerase III delta subunit
MFILHGENTVQSREALFQLFQQAKEKGQRVHRVEVKNLELAQLQQIVGNQSLFGEQEVIVVEELHSLPKSKRKEELIDWIGREGDEFILWEKRQLTPTMLKKFPGAQAREFKVSNVIFQWLESLPTRQMSLLQQAISSDGDFMCLTMLIRQIRFLIQAKEGNLAGMAPFIAAKLKKQATAFSLEQLLKIHHRLLTIDIGQKTSTSRMPLANELELLMVEM